MLQRLPNRLLLPCLLGSLLIAACAGESTAPPDAALAISAPKLLLPPPGADTAAGYMDLRNRADAPLTLGALSSPTYTSVELHDMEHDDDGMMRMRRIESLRIAPGETVTLAPHGRHLMLMEPQIAPQSGDTVVLRIRYRLDGESYTREVSLPAESR